MTKIVLKLNCGDSNNPVLAENIPFLENIFGLPFSLNILLAPVVQRLDNAIHRINHYPADSVVCFANTYPLDSDLSGG